MKRIAVLYPIFFAIYPVLSLLAANLSETPITQAIRPLLIYLLFSSGLLWALSKVCKDTQRAAFITFLVVLALFYYQIAMIVARILPGNLGVAQQSWGIFILWAGFLGVLGTPWLWRKIKHHETLALALTVAGIIVVGISLVSIGFFYAERWFFRTTQSSVIHLEGEPQPDIYYIIVDGYAGAEVLQDLYGYDNTPFLEFLRQRGFYVADAARSNYIQTTVSLASSLNLDYVTELPANSSNRGLVWNLIQYSTVRATLEQHGYQTVSLTSGYQYTELRDADLYLSHPDIPEINLFEAALLLTSPARILIDDLNILTGMLPTRRTHQDRILYVFEQLRHIPSVPGPKFVFAHFIAPHPPFVFDRDGQRLGSDEIFLLVDGDRFPGSVEEYLTGYAEQLVYINTLLMETLDAILENSATPPIILLQADHGPGAFTNFQSLADTCIWERTSILSAYYLPGVDTVPLYDSVTPVNSFRIVFDAYFGTDLGLLEDRVYYSTWSRPYDFIDVTELSYQPCELP